MTGDQSSPESVESEDVASIEDGSTEEDVTEDDVTEDDVPEDGVTEDDVPEDDVTEDDVPEDNVPDDASIEDVSANAALTDAASAFSARSRFSVSILLASTTPLLFSCLANRRGTRTFTACGTTRIFIGVSPYASPSIMAITCCATGGRVSVFPAKKLRMRCPKC